MDFLVDLGPPDVFALYEVEGEEVFGALVSKMPGYTFHITEGPQVQEIMVGVSPASRRSSRRRPSSRAGYGRSVRGLCSRSRSMGSRTRILFLHTKSGVEPLGLGLRDDMLNRALDFKKVLEKAAQGPVHYLFLGDLNTMGMEYKYLRERDIEADQEILKISKFAAGREMRLLTKDELVTWWGGPNTLIPPSNLDQVVAADHLQFKSINGADVTVLGWPKEGSASAQGEWIDEHSDHGCLYFEVQRVDSVVDEPRVSGA